MGVSLEEEGGGGRGGMLLWRRSYHSIVASGDDGRRVVWLKFEGDNDDKVLASDFILWILSLIILNCVLRINNKFQIQSSHPFHFLFL